MKSGVGDIEWLARYMRICGFVAESLRGERIVHDSFPQKELQDYWSTRPRYEDKREDPFPSGSGANSHPSFRLETSEAIDLLPPPPPYSLMDDNPSSSSSSPSISRHTSAGPPLPPRTTRPGDVPDDPSLSRATSVGSTTSAQRQEPPVNTATRPQSRPPPPVPDSSNRPQSVYSIDALSEQMGRQLIHGSHIPGERPALPPGRPAPHPYGPSWAPSNSPPPGGWSQAPWPPPQWGVGPQPPQGPPGPWSYPGETYRNQQPYGGYFPPPGPPPAGYAPPPAGYVMADAPPPLRPRPSMSSHSSGRPTCEEGSHFPEPYQHPSPYGHAGLSPPISPAHASFPMPMSNANPPQPQTPFGGYLQGPGEYPGRPL